MMRAQVERQYDDMERLAIQAMMYRQAQHAKRLKQVDLFKRPGNEKEANSKAEAMKERADRQREWLSQFEEFNGKI